MCVGCLPLPPLPSCNHSIYNSQDSAPLQSHSGIRHLFIKPPATPSPTISHPRRSFTLPSPNAHTSAFGNSAPVR
ncbi:hypothetical protein B0H34DRAFT_726239 [Crassisporium funariophilum]|nr:hypothetical protein B0H34DRAFT_726130 [Crassisporium funariophilum]KAF8152502.1 hypothetical protein B0H34DRAFT_726239 [Crassisporium funariophilum]